MVVLSSPSCDEGNLDSIVNEKKALESRISRQSWNKCRVNKCLQSKSKRRSGCCSEVS